MMNHSKGLEHAIGLERDVKSLDEFDDEDYTDDEEDDTDDEYNYASS